MQTFGVRRFVEAPRVDPYRRAAEGVDAKAAAAHRQAHGVEGKPGVRPLRILHQPAFPEVERLPPGAHAETPGLYVAGLHVALPQVHRISERGRGRRNLVRKDPRILALKVELQPRADPHSKAQPQPLQRIGVRSRLKARAVQAFDAHSFFTSEPEPRGQFRVHIAGNPAGRREGILRGGGERQKGKRGEQRDTVKRAWSSVSICETLIVESRVEFDAGR